MENYDETHTAIADYEKRAEAVDVTINHPHSSCYDRMPEQTGLLGHARVHQKARKIRKLFKEIAKEENAMLQDGGLLIRKGVLTVLRGKALFSTDHLVLVCQHIRQSY